jgi:hypothetical protein
VVDPGASTVADAGSVRDAVGSVTARILAR